MKEQLIYVDRRGTNSYKWDSLRATYSRDDLLPMSIADMDFKTPLCVREALKEYVDMGAIGYSMTSGDYYRAFLDWEKTRHGVDIPREWIRYAPGVVVAIAWLLEQLTVPGDCGMILTPVYGPFAGMLKQHGLRVVGSDLKNDGGVYTIDFQDVEEKLAAEQVKVFLLCSPHNPVGRVWTREELERLTELCRKYQVFLISDEIHQDIIMPGHKQISLLSVVQDPASVAVLTSTAKSFNLAGVENAFMVLPGEEVRRKIDAMQDRIATHSGNGLGYVAVTAAYTGGAAWLDAVCEQVYENAQYVRSELTKALPGLMISPLEGTFLLWVNFAPYLKEGEDLQSLLVDRCGLVLNSGKAFGGEQYATFARINLATSRENVALAVERLIACFAK